MTEEIPIEDALSRIGQRLVQIEQTIQDNLRHCLENKLPSHEPATGVSMDECLEVLRQEINRVVGEGERPS